ncbi:MAG: hypothetical protein IPH43_01885 [Xanthomonadales bacterium]|nr:hypothetical protein [Xanthomonadales bacterium]MBK7211400.1 hypothetical protein [Xanthomonadales bacterium]MBL0221424.1 hypothetical protein [Xanthomonadales bacterium]HQV71690.1 hypothetical protein [Dokdonella sp.]HQY54916.1 hypothetical protein [Dokdonella sp.]
MAHYATCGERAQENRGNVGLFKRALAIVGTQATAGTAGLAHADAA